MATATDEARGLAPRFRPMTREDVSTVVAIEQHTYPFPWTEQVFRDCLRVGYDCWVVEGDDGVAGYGIMSAGAGECHVLNLCLAPVLRRRGIGRRLLFMLLDRARRAGMLHALLEVRPSNDPAIALYGSAGFERIGVRRGYYQAHDGREDAVVYRLALDHLPAG
jgi:ribosomal-protein-alanine N-acetyltransferase